MSRRPPLNRVLGLVLPLVLACGKSDDEGPKKRDLMVAELVALGFPADVAGFFADASRTIACDSNTSCVVTHRYPNGASRTVTMKAVADQSYALTAEEMAALAASTQLVFRPTFKAIGFETDPPADTARVDIGFYLPASVVSPAKVALPLKGDISPKTTLAPVPLAQTAGDVGGFSFSFTESATKGVDVAIGSLLEHFQKVGRPVEVTGSLYALASALSDVAGAVKISMEVKAALRELDALEKCAKDPANPLSQSDPNYIAQATSIVANARREVLANAAVRFLNLMDETAAGLSPATAVLSIGLKQAHSYVETTLQQASAETMRQVRQAVVSCKPSCPQGVMAAAVSETQIDLSWSAAMGGFSATEYTVTGGKVGSLSTPSTSYSDTGLSPSTNYCYVVNATNEYGTSENCPKVCAKTPGPPVVEATTPYSAAKNVPVSTTVTATFSEEMDPKTLSTTTFLVSGAAAVTGTVTYNGNTATFTPSSPLEKGKTYTVTITTGVTDLEGNPMREPFSWTFETETNLPAGNVQFTVSDMMVKITGSATVMWTLIETTSNTRKYQGSGTITGEITPNIPGCMPLQHTSTINGPANNMVVYPASNRAFPNTLGFALVADDLNTPLTFTCRSESSGQTFELTLPSWLKVEVGACGFGAFMPVPYKDETSLAGTYSCAASGQNVTWDFTK